MVEGYCRKVAFALVNLNFGFKCYLQTDAAVTIAVGRDLSAPFIPTQVCRRANVRPVMTRRQWPPCLCQLRSEDSKWTTRKWHQFVPDLATGCRISTASAPWNIKRVSQTWNIRSCTEENAKVRRDWCLLTWLLSESFIQSFVITFKRESGYVIYLYLRMYSIRQRDFFVPVRPHLDFFELGRYRKSVCIIICKSEESTIGLGSVN